MCWAVGMHSSLKCKSYGVQFTERVARLPRANLISDSPLPGWCKKDPSCQAPVIPQGLVPWLGTFTYREGDARRCSNGKEKGQEAGFK